MLEGERDKKKKVYPRLPDMFWARRIHLIYISELHLINFQV